MIRQRHPPRPLNTMCMRRGAGVSALVAGLDSNGKRAQAKSSLPAGHDTPHRSQYLASLVASRVVSITNQQHP